MDKLLLLGLSAFLCYFPLLPGSFLKPVLPAEFADTVQCRMCHIQFPGEKCSRGRGICTADKNEACAVGRIYKKQRNLWSIWLIFMGCQRNCAEVEKIKWSVYMVAFRCCRSADLCNENLTRSG